MPDLSNITDMLFGFLPKILWAMGGGTIVWIRRNMYFYKIWKRKIIVFFSRKKYVVIWNDDSIEISERIVNQLKKKKLSKYNFKIVASPESILYFPSSPSHVQAIILIVSDVTKLDESQKKRLEIENKLIDYASKGGTLIGTHDLIYRRCRNEKLQRAFGCTVKKFKSAMNGANVKKNEQHVGHPLLTEVDNTFVLKDNELTTGIWDSNVLQLLRTENEIDFGDSKCLVPVLCANTSSYDGTLIWISSGDKGDDVCDSIKLPDSNFVQILANSIRFRDEIRAYGSKKAFSKKGRKAKTTSAV